MRFSRFSEYSLQDSMVNDFLNSFDKMITESEEISYKKVQKKVISDLKLNIQFILTFGIGIGTFYPIVDKLMRNMSIESIELTPDKVVLLTIAAITIIYIEEKKFKSADEEEILTKDSKSMLEELKMMGIGNGIVKKLIKAFQSIKGIFSIISKHLGAVVGGFIDMFAYTGMLIPIMNGILYIVGKYDLNIDTLIQNFIGLAMGVGTIIAKHGITEIVNRLKDKFSINKKKVIDEIETPIIQKFGDIKDANPEQDGELIKEQ
jgi:hypothetical protein